MKLRMKGNSVRLRVGRSELARFLEGGRIEETVRLAAAPEASFTYALEFSQKNTAATVRYAPGDLVIVLSPEQVRLWQKEDQVGIYAQIDIGTGEALEIIVEKDFACLDGSDADNADAFANPTVAPNCQVV